MTAASYCDGCQRDDRYVVHGTSDGRQLCAACYVRTADVLLVEPSANGHRPVEPLKFVTSAELRRSTPREPAWLWAHYLVPGAITMLAGRPKAGKSTLACTIVEAIAEGAGELLGRPVGEGAVVYIAEEGASSLAHKLPVSDRVLVLTREAAWPRPSWAHLIAEAVATAQRVGAVLLVLDSLSFWAGFAEGQENDAGAAQAVMGALVAATAARLAVLLVHHQRKSGGEGGDAVRGTGAIFAAVDLLAEVERLGDDAPPGQRRLVGTGRWPSTPAVLVIERDAEHGAWRVVGEAASREATATMALRDSILAATAEDDPGSTEDELAAVLGVDKRKIGKPLRALVDEALVERSATGRKGDP